MSTKTLIAPSTDCLPSVHRLPTIDPHVLPSDSAYWPHALSVPGRPPFRGRRRGFWLEVTVVRPRDYPLPSAASANANTCVRFPHPNMDDYSHHTVLGGCSRHSDICFFMHISPVQAICRLSSRVAAIPVSSPSVIALLWRNKNLKVIKICMPP